MPDPTSAEGPVRSARLLLGVTADADAAEVARAYRRQARHVHPDVSLEPDAASRFDALHVAYQVALAAVRPHPARAAAGPTPVERQAPPVMVGFSRVQDVPTGPRRGSGSDGWLVAGPVRVEPPLGPADAPTSPEGRP
jgi:hypothetical protein